MTETLIRVGSAPPYRLEVYYVDGDDAGLRFRVVIVSPTDRRERFVPCSYEPRFGIDMADMNDIDVAAEDMIAEIEGTPT